MIACAMAERYRRFAACCALALSFAGTLPGASHGGTGPAGFAGGDPVATGDARALAERILRREGDGLLFNERRLGELTREIGEVLARVRERFPALAAIGVRRQQGPATLLLGVEAGLQDAISGRGEDGNITGHRAFDALNTRLRVRKMRLYPALRIVALETGAGVNIDAARRAYLAIDGVAFAEADARLGDGSDIETARSAGIWHVVFRRAWGDCPSGCMHAEFFFFTVDGADVRALESRSARDMNVFAAILARRGWD